MRDCSKPRARCCLGARRLAPMAAGGPEPCLLCSQEFLGRAGDGALPVEPAPLLPLAHRLPSRAGFLEGDRSSDSSFPNGLQVKNSAQKYRHTRVHTHAHPIPLHMHTRVPTFSCAHFPPPPPIKFFPSTDKGLGVRFCPVSVCRKLMSFLPAFWGRPLLKEARITARVNTT